MRACMVAQDSSIGVCGVRIMELIEIDVVSLQIVQTDFDFTADARRSEVFPRPSLLVGERTALGKNVDFVALSPHGFAYDLFGSPPAIKGGGINPVDAKIKSHLNGAYGFAFT